MDDAVAGREVEGFGLRQVAVVVASVAVGYVLLRFGHLTSQVEDGAGLAWSLVAVVITIGAAGSAGGIDPAGVARWVRRHRWRLGLGLAPAVVSWVLVAAGVRELAWLTDPTPVGAAGLGLALSSAPVVLGWVEEALSRGRQRRPRRARA